MTYRGRVQGGVVVLDPGATLPEDIAVSVAPVEDSRVDAAVEATEETIGQKLARLGRSVESMPCDLPSDLAANHDYYLHGLPKRQ
jgi:hypothetical protein